MLGIQKQNFSSSFFMELRTVTNCYGGDTPAVLSVWLHEQDVGRQRKETAGRVRVRWLPWCRVQFWVKRASGVVCKFSAAKKRQTCHRHCHRKRKSAERNRCWVGMASMALVSFLASIWTTPCVANLETVREMLSTTESVSSASSVNGKSCVLAAATMNKETVAG